MARTDELRLMARIARLYYVQGARQTEISRRLHIHQSTVSRMLQRAEAAGIIRVTVSAPPGIYSELEERLEEKFGLKQAIVVESRQDDDQLARDLGGAAAFLIDSTVKGGEIIGVSCCSAALTAMVNVLPPSRGVGGGKVVQIFGNGSHAAAQSHSEALVRRLAHLLLADPVSLSGSGAGPRQVVRDISPGSQLRQASSLFTRLDIALVGIGALELTRLDAAIGGAAAEELRELRLEGAVGDICLQFFDARGLPVETEVSRRVTGVRLGDLKRTRLVVGISGGRRRAAAILGALRGGWIHTLITDRSAAEELVNCGGSAKKSSESLADTAPRRIASPFHAVRRGAAAVAECGCTGS